MMHLHMPSAKWRMFCVGPIIVLINYVSVVSFYCFNMAVAFWIYLKIPSRLIIPLCFVLLYKHMYIN